MQRTGAGRLQVETTDPKLGGPKYTSLGMSRGSTAIPRTPTRFNKISRGATRASDLLEGAKRCQDNLSRSEPIHGNIYTYWAFLRVLERYDLVPQHDRGSHLLLQVGLSFVVVVQIIGPPAVLIWSMYAMTWEDVKFGLGDWKYVHGSYDHGISVLFSRLLGTLFLFVFILNGMYVIREDRRTSDKIWFLVRALDENGSGTSVDTVWLWVGAAINSWCVVISALCMGPCFALTQCPKDIIFDAFALLFLFRLDDVTGDLGFLTDQWDSDLFGNFYEYVVNLEERHKLESIEEEKEGEEDSDATQSSGDDE
ncbi:unnamed protein product, partial [Polarella glacialis]